MIKDKLMIKKTLVNNLNYQKIETLIREAFSIKIDNVVNPISANITIDEIVTKKESNAFSVFDSNNIVGILIYKITDKICYVDKLAVSPKYQSLGIGKALINKLFDECETLRVKKIWLYTFEYSHNIRFYESVGFIKYGLKRNTNYYFSIIYCKYFNKSIVRNFILYIKYWVENLLYKKVFFHTPSKLTIIGEFVKKIKNVFKK